MRFIRIAFKRETAAPMFALIFASGICVSLVITRIAWTGTLRYGFLIWNLFLAWLPLVFALLAGDTYRAADGRRWRWQFAGLAGAWLLFFPNAPYIFTDLIHLTNWYFFHFWIDLALFLMCALTGLVLGFLSLYQMQSVVTQMFGRVASWIFIAGVAALSGLGVYIGRVLRFNSWDIVTKPAALYQSVGNWASDPFSAPVSPAFPPLFAAFVFTAYLMLYALTHLSPTHLPARERPLKEAP